MTRGHEAALSAAKEAGKVLRKGFGWQHSVRYKGEVDVVTKVDGANLAKVLSGRRKRSRVMLAKLEAALEQFSQQLDQSDLLNGPRPSYPERVECIIFVSGRAMQREPRGGCDEATCGVPF